MNIPPVTVIGIGRLGGALVQAVVSAGISVKSVYNRHPGKAEKLATEVNARYSGRFPEKLKETGSLIFLTVPDDRIMDIARKLSALEGPFEQCIVAHCSGSLTSGALSPVAERGALTASFHPLQTFSRVTTQPADAFRGITVSLQGDDQALPVLKGLARELNANPLQVSADQKAALHVAGVFASNYLHTLLEAAVQTAEFKGLKPEAIRKALLPLMRSTLENAAGAGNPADALSGPVARGDTGTVQNHLELLKSEDNLRELYKLLGRHTVNIVKDSLDEKKIREFKTLFEDNNHE